MATEWIKPVSWNNEGAEPSAELIANGFEAGYRPPADVFNHQWHQTGECISQLQEVADQHETDLENHTHDDATSSQSGFMPATHAEYVEKYRNLVGVSGNTNGSFTVGSGTSHGATGKYAIAIGEDCLASGKESIAIGEVNQASGSYAVSIGHYGLVSGEGSAQFGGNTVYSSYSFAAGTSCSVVSGGYGSAALGLNSYASGYGQVVVGKYNKQQAGATASNDTTGSAFIVGVGTGSTAANGFRVTNAGKCMGTSTFTASGADYAEYYEWIDGNPKNEDRRGYFVTLDGTKIRKATATDDYILGVVSSTPAVIGNGFTDMWHNMYLTDVFGERLTEVVEVAETTNEETGEVIPAHTETRFILNPEYDIAMPYVGRHERKEWSAIGTHGQLVVVDDGTCEVNGYCKVADGGTATKAEGKTEYRVTERLDENYIRIVIK